LIPVFDLGLQPLANDFCAEEEERAGFAPLKVLLCPNCHLAQLSVTVDPTILYRRYLYVTSTSKTMLDHFQYLWELLPINEPVPRVLEIGSNDGLFLEFIKHQGCEVVGVDPSLNLSKISGERGVCTYNGFWNQAFAEANPGIRHFEPDFIFARHVFCHVDDWRDFIAGIELVSTVETLTCIEVPYVGDLLEKGEFDTIYHEHTSYLSVKSIAKLLEGTKLRLHRIEKLAIHGGALLVMIRHKDSKDAPHKSVSEYFRNENVGLEAWRDFAVRCQGKIEALRSVVRKAKSEGKRVVGYGASAKSTVWLNACGFTRKEIDYITDNTMGKLYKLSPGNDIPIVNSDNLHYDQPDFAIMFCWNFAEEVIAKEKIFLEKGGKWVIPHPNIKVIDGSGEVVL